MSEFHAESNTNSGSCSAPSGEGFRWRAWPCAKCSGGVTAISQLRGGTSTSTVVPAPTPEEIASSQVAVLKKWVASCNHSSDNTIVFPRLAEGSEHLVFLDAAKATVFKATRPGLFGESYYLDAKGKMNQKNCSPLEYLIRLRLWRKLFSSAPRDLGITDQGQIVSSHEFIVGKKPTQDAVDSFLIEAGLTAVKQKYWLWKKAYPRFEIWLGDAREDNFVETEAGIVPIDIRLWFSSLPSFTEFFEW